MTFKEWMRAVDRIVVGTAGVSVFDLADYSFRDSFNDGVSPQEVADAVLSEAGFPSDEDGDGYEGDIE